MRRLILVAGPSGSGKTRLARHAGVATLRLDDFYLDADHPGLPMSHGIVDWDDPRSWDLDGACAAIRELLETGQAVVPHYSIAQNKRVGSHEVTVPDGEVVLAEGIFAIEAASCCDERGLPAERIWLDRPGAATFWRRLSRDLRQHRKPPHVLVRRGLALWRDERTLRAEATAAGFRPCTMRTAQRIVGEARAHPA